MSSRLCWRFAQLICLALVTATEATNANEAKLSTFDKPNGEIIFALSLSPSEQLEPAEGHDIVILFDTSASQTGLYRDDAVAALETVLKHLAPKDRVQLMAVDLDAIPLSIRFDGAESDTTRQALKKLSERLPLGSTDMMAGLTAALERFDNGSDRPRRVLFIGDGVSRANILETREFGNLVKRYVDHKISVVSFGIGPKRDILLLSILANHTGGHVYVDSNQNSPQQAGGALAAAVRTPVVWPKKTDVSTGFSEVYPALMPPLRTDRDSVVIGTLSNREKQSIQLQGDVNGRQVQWNWQLEVQPSSEDFAHVSKLVDISRQDLGLSLPTAGSAVLVETQRIIMTGANRLSKMSAQALAQGDVSGARMLADAALAHDPHNPQAKVMQSASASQRNRAVVRVAQVNDGDFLGGLSDAGEMEGVLGPADSDAPLVLRGEPIQTPERPDGELLGQVEARRRANQDALRVEVRSALSAASDLMSTNPDEAVTNLKIFMQDVRQAIGIDTEVRSQLADQIESAIREGERRRIEKDRLDAEAAENLAIARERQRILESLGRQEARQGEILDRFNALMDEGNFLDAQAAAFEAKSLSPTSAHAELAILASRLQGNVERVLDIRDRRHRMFSETLAQVEESMIPFPDEPPLVYPDPEFWEELTNRRAKYKAIDLANTGGAEEKILTELEEETTFDFFETPLEEVAREISDLHNITVVLDKQALEDLALDPSEPISKELSGITLRSALRLMLRDLELTYVIADEVLQITTQERAGSSLVTKVYPVGDLVLPIQSGIGLGGGMMGGGMMGGGMMGGGMMGGGMGGGMMGGMGGGMMGGGGFFAVDDELKLSTNDQAGVAKPRAIIVDATENSVERAWNAFFASQRKLDTKDRASAADIRQTVREAFGRKDYAAAASIMQAALRHGFPQPWMYEALALTLEAGGAEKSEIERALMSAVDFSDSIDEIFFVAGYMARNGFEQRALKLFREVAEANPARPEPFTLALKTAQRIGDHDALQWASIGVLRQAWPNEHQHLRNEAVGVAKRAYQELTKAGKVDEAQQLRDAVNYALMRDCVAEVSWTGDADVDIYVEEPTGTVCSAQNPRTTAGGVLMGDVSAETGNSGDRLSETYVCPEGFSGRYRLLIQPVYGEVTAGKVSVKLTVAKGSDHEQTIHKQIPVADKKVVVVFDLPSGRRREVLREQQVATVAKRLDVKRTVLAQQLDQTSSSSALNDFALDRALLANGLIPRLRSAVGYQPVITTIPEGTNMFATAVISADRRYVRISPSPIFSGIGDVFNFNITGGQNTAGGTGATGGGLGGGGGGLGGGGFGGGGGGFGGGGFGGGF